MDTPDGLHELQYARHILEEVLGWPAKGNLELIGDCIRSIGLSRKLSLVQSHAYLLRAIKLAKEQQFPVDKFFFQDGKYTEIRPEKARTGEDCPRHPESNRTPWGTCWGCYAEKHTDPANYRESA